MQTALLSDNKKNIFSISKVILSNFRNYSNLVLELDSTPVVITGTNGSGKTNILEAISLLSPGRGLRSVKLDELNNKSGTSPWAIAAWIRSNKNEIKIGTGRETASQANKRIVKIDGNIIRGQEELAHAFGVMWLTPQMDGLFLEATSERRKFLDRLVYNFNPEHASLIYSYEYSMRERSRLLKENFDKSWLSILEAKMAKKAVAIAIARIDTINIIQQAIYSAPGIFPKATISVDGVVEKMVGSLPALEIEGTIKKKLHDTRSEDARSGRTNIGTHRSDFIVTHIGKNMPAYLCSTGEQKALLLTIILAEARAKALWKNNVPVLLLDEVVAHLDNERRIALFDEFIEMGAQVWLTGTDKELFASLSGTAQFLEVSNGNVRVYT